MSEYCQFNADNPDKFTCGNPATTRWGGIPFCDLHAGTRAKSPAPDSEGIPQSFNDALDDVKHGRIVDMDIAMTNQPPQTTLESTGYKFQADSSAESEIPRTKELWADTIKWCNGRGEVADQQHAALANLCEQLERELAQAIKERDEAREQWRMSSVCRELNQQLATAREALENPIAYVSHDEDQDLYVPCYTPEEDDGRKLLIVVEQAKQALAAIEGGENDQ